ncbi:MAG: NAD(P)H-dependent glycerol-3-phosphate dehydrogenase [Succinivibrio sp.]|nr:NAD(P)H-dependent glycerol-3-phosphate dehydrogenase [Succinivibrio sp.]
MPFNASLTVIGAGSYGTALAVSTASKGLKVVLWGRNSMVMEKIRQDGYNEKYLPGVVFPPSLQVTSDLQQAVESAEIILLVVPSHTFHSVLGTIIPYLTAGQRLFWATKGIDPETGKLLSEIARELLPDNMPLAAISGPTFAMELAKGLPTAISVSGTDRTFIKDISNLMHTPTFRIYESDDFVGLQLGGTVKNVIAIACGLSDGLGYGANARTALITRGMAEMVRYGVTRGATDRGFMGLSGLGDLILTCTDNQSRNRRFGFMLGQGLDPETALTRIGQVVEGYTMTRVMKHLGEQSQVQMPICNELYEVIYQGKSGKEAAASLLSRSQKAE